MQGHLIFAQFSYFFLTDFVNRFFELKNIALKKPVVSTIYHLPGSLAVDGIISCSNSNYFQSHWKDYPWLRVDLERRAVVLNITVKSHYEHELNPFKIRVGDHSECWHNPQCGGDVSVPKNAFKNFTCPEQEGRYVSIHARKSHERSSRRIILCEVQIYGIYLLQP